MSPITTTILLSLQIITSFLLTATASSSPPGGFSIDVIHRRSNTSSSRFSKTDDQLGSPYANTVFTTSEYLMKLQIGTPPVDIEALIDTASSIVWTQCLPCLSCYDQQDPIFDPSTSSTYKEKICDQDLNNPCRYEITYVDQSYSKGAYATETVTLQSTSGQPFVMAETTIGCGHNNSVTSAPAASGIIGLDRGASSLISQMSENFFGFFSYCFSRKETSKINFGSNAVVSGHGTVSTTMFRNTEKPNFYYLNLDAISVGENRVETMGTSLYSLEGNIIIDSGTTYTYLPDSFCTKVKDAVDSVVKVEQADFSGDMLCYNTADIDIFPVITMHFTGGADLVLDKYNMYDNTGDSYCLAISCVRPTEDAVFGNRAQNNWLVGYDTSSELVSFKSTDCSALY
ncbi:Aspartic proteinase CDR1-like protein [Hirschfeldia incana]|nr:Aspartic proteinase CDR1-like protein [Hirschfeldia incana]